MAEGVERDSGRLGSGTRIGIWLTGVVVLLMVPLVAMQFTDEVNWNVFDFVFAGALLTGTGVAFELAARKTGDGAYRTGVGFALAAAFLLIWVNGAVGLIGSEDNPANLMYGGVLAVAVFGALIVRLRPRGMAYALAATALAQTLVTMIAVIGGLGAPVNGPAQLIFANALFVALWLISAGLFRQAADGESA
jgi:hypothetical protein